MAPHECNHEDTLDQHGRELGRINNFLFTGDTPVTATLATLVVGQRETNRRIDTQVWWFRMIIGLLAAQLLTSAAGWLQGKRDKKCDECGEVHSTEYKEPPYADGLKHSNDGFHIAFNCDRNVDDDDEMKEEVTQ